MTDQVDMIQVVGEKIKPFVPMKHIPHLIKSLYGLTVKSCKELDSYIDKNYHVIVTGQSENPYIKHPEEDGYVLKILNKMQSKNPQFVGNAILFCFFFCFLGFYFLVEPHSWFFSLHLILIEIATYHFYFLFFRSVAHVDESRCQKWNRCSSHHEKY